MSTTHIDQPILVEIGQESWESLLDNLSSWLDTTLLAQSAFRQLAEDTAGKINDPRVKEQIQCIADSARGHEERVKELYRMIGRQPSDVRSVLGALMGKMRQGLADLLGMEGSAAGAWPDIRQMMLANLNAIGAFGSVQECALSLGLPDVATHAFAIVRDKSTEQLVLQEYMLEVAPQAILYNQAI